MSSNKDRLFEVIWEAGPMVIAFSGGVDSTLLLAAAHEVLGSKAIAATAVSDIHPRRELDEAKAFVRKKKIHHVLFSSRETNLPAFAANPADRCYHCKKHLFGALWQIGEQTGLRQVTHGANRDDLDDYRPGMKAAQEMDIGAPLVAAGLGKAAVRSLAKEMDLDSWNRPAMACLATRIPYGTTITPERLRMVDQAETFLLNLGIERCRVRHHGTIARLELDPAGMARILKEDMRHLVVTRLRDIGFGHITMDLEGYVSGSMNRALDLDSESQLKGVKP